MTLASARIRLKEAYQENDWFTIAILLLQFGKELLSYFRELQAERKERKSLEKSKE
jgi:hypothetical protein